MQRILFFFTIITLILSACTPLSKPTPQITELPVVTPTPSLVPTPTALPPQNNVQGGQVNILCKNSLSDAAAINAAITSSSVGDEIVISGQCLINQTIKLLGDRTYRGTSRTGTVLKQADGANLVALLATDTYLENREWTGTPVTIRQMTLDGNSKANQQAQTDGIILRSWWSVVEDMYINDMSQDGIEVAYKSADGTKLKTSQVNGTISRNFINASGRHGVYEELGVTDWYLTDNEIAFSGADGLHLEDVAGWFIVRNNIYGVPNTAIHAEHLFGTTISDNYIEGFGETKQAGIWYGIYGTVQGGAASTISNNRILNFGVNLNGPGNSASIYRYLALSVNYDTGVVSITGNTVRGMGVGDETGLYYTSGGNHQLIVTSAGNAVVDVKTPRFTDSGVTLSPGY
jgi:hypothetical protein